VPPAEQRIRAARELGLYASSIAMGAKMDREGMQSRLITGIGEIKVEKVVDPTDERSILQIETYTSSGPLVLRINELVAIELSALLKKHSLIRGRS
jgi:hypothetical protein